MGALYLITGPTGKEYVGITSRSIDERIEEHHTWGVRRGTGYLHAAMRKHGVNAFSVKVLVLADDWDYLCELERKAIAAFGCKAPNGYNATDGGDGVPNLDHESKIKHRENTSIGTAKAWASGKMDGRANTFSSAEFKEKHKAATSAAVRKAYESPEFRAKTIAALTSESKKQSNRAAALAQWSDPEKRERLLAANRDPAVQAARSASIRATWARKKAARIQEN